MISYKIQLNPTERIRKGEVLVNFPESRFDFSQEFSQLPVRCNWEAGIINLSSRRSKSSTTVVLTDIEAALL